MGELSEKVQIQNKGLKNRHFINIKAFNIKAFNFLEVFLIFPKLGSQLQTSS